MCTAVSITSNDNYFGRNLDLEHSYGEKVVITPRNFSFTFSNGKTIFNHYAIIGMAVISEGYPLYFDGTNEKGLSVAGLNFPANAFYNEPVKNKDNIASFEFITWILSQCKNLAEAKELLLKINITNIVFSDNFAPTPLHFIVSDKDGSVTFEQTKNGAKVFENPIGILTNNPTFDIHIENLSNYMSLSACDPENTFTYKISLKTYSKGMGAIGLPGDCSSMSRFVRASFVASNSHFEGTEVEKVCQFFHVLKSVEHQKGCIRTKDGFEITTYSSCTNATRGIYYYTTYYNSAITGVDMHRENLDGKELISYDLIKQKELFIQNGADKI